MAKTKVAILGGGIGALSAAFDITEQDPDGSLFEITLYQMGWRLGGKCAVGWTDGPSEVRVEHGLHVWAGFYDNAFDLLQRCYDAMVKPPFADWRDAFERLDDCWVEEPDGGSGLNPWRQHIAPNGLAGGLGQVPFPDQLWGALLNLVSNVFFASNLRDFAGRRGARAGSSEARAAGRPRVRDARRRLESEGFGLREGQRTLLLDLLRSTHDDLDQADLVGAPAQSQHTAILVNLGVALLLGMLDGGVLTQGFDVLDGEEWSDWVAAYGGWVPSLNSGVVVGLYDYIFGVPGGVRSVGAGTGTRALLRLLFMYKGSFFYAPNLALGDLLIAPLYKVLYDRGVTFKFFHRVDRLLLSKDGRSVDGIEIGIQIYPTGSRYDPLIAVGDLDTWPSSPVYGRLLEGDKLEASGADLEWPDDPRWKDVYRIVLERGKEFDLVVLGISLGALSAVCSDLAKRLPAWDDMLGAVKTTATMAMQLWSELSVGDYKWPPSAIVSALPGPLTTWGDNSQLIDEEQWPAKKPRSLAYFVGNFPDYDVSPPEQLAVAKRMATDWRRDVLPRIWANYDDSQLATDPYVRVNVHPSDRYVLSVPGSLTSRLRPDGSGVNNLYLAGDWVRIGLNAGCVEQAVLGGRAAARAITGVDMNSQYDGDFSSQLGPGAPSIKLIGLFNLLPDLRRAGDAGAGSADACCVVSYLPKRWVSELLPLGLELGSASRDIPTDYWPVAMMFVRQSHVRPGLAPPIGGLNYDEFVLIVPNVYHSDKQWYKGPFCYMPTILLDSLGALVIGKGLYGLKKRSALIRAYPDSFDIRFDEGEISAYFANKGLPGTFQDFPKLGEIRSYLEQVIIGETSTGSWVYCYLEHNLDAAEFQPIEGKIRGRGKRFFETEFFPLINQKLWPDVRTHGGHIIPAAAGFRMLTNWTITYPIVKGHYDPAPKQRSVRAFASAMTERLFPVLGRFPPR